jgi:putative chitinase
MSAWKPILRDAFPKGRGDILDGLADAIPTLISEFEINTPLRMAHFLAQCAHESDRFRTMVEYASGAAYEGRKNLGNIVSGDGIRYKGRGIIQLTGRANYTQCGKDLGIDLVNNPTMAASMPTAARIAGWYWQKRRINRHADNDDIKSVTKAINGGYNGLSDRKAHLAKLKPLIASADFTTGWSVFNNTSNKTADLDDGIEERESELTSYEIKAIQQKLRDLGYFEVGKPDGYIGSRTRGALSAFQSNSGLPVNGLYDKETRLALHNAEPREVDPVRRTSIPQDSRIIKGAEANKTAASLLSLPAIGGLADQLTTSSDIIKQVVTSFKTTFAIFAPVLKFWPIILFLVCIFLFIRANGIKKARIEDNQTGKTA